MAMSYTKVVVSARCQLFTLRYCSWLQLFSTAHSWQRVPILYNER